MKEFWLRAKDDFFMLYDPTRRKCLIVKSDIEDPSHAELHHLYGGVSRLSNTKRTTIVTMRDIPNVVYFKCLPIRNFRSLIEKSDQLYSDLPDGYSVIHGHGFPWVGGESPYPVIRKTKEPRTDIWYLYIAHGERMIGPIYCRIPLDIEVGVNMHRFFENSTAERALEVRYPIYARHRDGAVCELDIKWVNTHASAKDVRRFCYASDISAMLLRIADQYRFLHEIPYNPFRVCDEEKQYLFLVFTHDAIYRKRSGVYVDRILVDAASPDEIASFIHKHTPEHIPITVDSSRNKVEIVRFLRSGQTERFTHVFRHR
ncbi:MAG: hypothetical protein QXT45_07845 [Candidatus Bilamarchaeaceae archaeon]